MSHYRQQLVRGIAAAASTIAMLLICLPAYSQDPFSQGAKRVSIIAGAGSSFNENYLILGAGFGYYVLDGLEIGLNWQSWLGGDPDINQITPEINYVFRTKSNLDPYVGALYRKTFISGLDDLEAWGARAGIYVPLGPRYFMGVGAVYLDYVDCQERIYRDCSDVYPEITFSIPF